MFKQINFNIINWHKIMIPLVWTIQVEQMLFLDQMTSRHINILLNHTFYLLLKSHS